MGREMITFEFPWIISALPIPLIVWILSPSNKISHDSIIPEITFPYTKRLAAAFLNNKKYKPQSNKLFISLLSLLWIFLVLSLMHPLRLNTASHIERKAYDIMLAVDISESMYAIDFASNKENITRLEVAKKVVSNFIEKRTGDRLGLILFGEHAYLHVPMTFDTFALKQMLEYSTIGMAGYSTAIGDAIGLAARELKTREIGAKILILLTDGSDTSSNIPPIEAAKIAQDFGIRIYIIGIGNDGMASYIDTSGKKQKIKLDMDEKLLQEIATITKGQYFKAKDDISLEKIYSKINELEKIELSTMEYTPQSLYRYPLGASCFLFLVICLMPLYKRSIYGI